MKLLRKELVQYSSKDKRLPKIKRLREQGQTLESIGKIYNLTRERIRQIIESEVTEKVLYVYQCPKCGSEESWQSKKNDNKICFPCSVNRRSSNVNRKQLLAKIYRDQPEWRKQGSEFIRYRVRYRDNFTCQVCGIVRTPEEVAEHNNKKKTGKGKIKLHDVHHLGGLCGKKSKGYDNAQGMDMLITLCHKCHYNHPEHTLQKRGNKKSKVINTIPLSN